MNDTQNTVILPKKKQISNAMRIVAIILCLLSIGGFSYSIYEVIDGKYAFYKELKEEYDDEISEAYRLVNNSSSKYEKAIYYKALLSLEDDCRYYIRKLEEYEIYVILVYIISGAMLATGITLFIVDGMKRKKARQLNLAAASFTEIVAPYAPKATTDTQSQSSNTEV